METEYEIPVGPRSKISHHSDDGVGVRPTRTRIRPDADGSMPTTSRSPVEIGWYSSGIDTNRSPETTRKLVAPLGPGEERATTVVVTYTVLLHEGQDGSDYTLERTHRSLVPPTREGGPYLTQGASGGMI